MDTDESYMGRLGTIIIAFYKNLTLTKSPHFQYTNKRIPQTRKSEMTLILLPNSPKSKWRQYKININLLTAERTKIKRDSRAVHLSRAKRD